MMPTFKERFDELFQESDKTQEEFGCLFNANKNQVYNWRSGLGEPDTAMLVLIAQACHVSVDWLTGNTNLRTPVNTLIQQRIHSDLTTLPPKALEEIEEFEKFLQFKYNKK
ncbi:helix-turn-helix transcriptional regulator [Azotosporobacter soli]|uniref:helix-turn-helix domain-containing protein n=1 Tax=Azotosporobacter soli TaxID=3055040 RepID=UPI0031FEF587